MPKNPVSKKGSPLSKVSNSLNQELLEGIIDTLLDKKGLNILFINLLGAVDYTDGMILVTGSSKTHNLALSDHLKNEIKKKLGVRPALVEGEDSGRWIILDYHDFIIHVFDAYTRDYYDLESFWISYPRTEFFLDDEDGEKISRLKP